MVIYFFFQIELDFQNFQDINLVFEKRFLFNNFSNLFLLSPTKLVFSRNSKFIFFFSKY